MKSNNEITLDNMLIEYYIVQRIQLVTRFIKENTGIVVIRI